MAGNLHYVVDIHSGKIHQSRARASGSMRMNQLVFLVLLDGLLAALGALGLDDFRQTGQPGHLLDIVIDILVAEFRNVEIVLLQNAQQLGRAKPYVLLLRSTAIIFFRSSFVR